MGQYASTINFGILEAIWFELLTLEFLQEFFLAEQDYDDGSEFYAASGPAHMQERRSLHGEKFFRELQKIRN